jgi:hypothetical protein
LGSLLGIYLILGKTIVLILSKLVIFLKTWDIQKLFVNRFQRKSLVWFSIFIHVYFLWD